MNPTRPLTLAAAACLLAACGEDAVLQDAEGRFRVVGQCSPRTLTAALQEHTGATMVVAIDEGPAAIVAAVEGAGRAQRPFVVCIGAEPAADAPAGDSVVVAATGAREAVDLALLACNDVALPPRRIELGARVVTPADRAAGGRTRLAPGDVYLATLRAQHRQHLTTDLAIDIAYGVGLATDVAADAGDGDVAWREQLTRELRAAVDHYPQLMLQEPLGDEPGPALAQARALLDRGVRVLLLATSDAATSRAVVALAAARDEGAVPVVVLDRLMAAEHEACHVGCPPGSLGLAAAEEVQRLLPEGGALILCVATTEDAATRLRRDAFCEAMRLRP